MSDTVKLIIEIPKEDIEFIRKTSFVEDEKTMVKQSPSDRQGTMTLFRLMDSIKNGIPLDDVINKIDKAYDDLDGYDPYALGTFANRISDILDNIGKESEVKPNDHNKV